MHPSWMKSCQGMAQGATDCKLRPAHNSECKLFAALGQHKEKVVVVVVYLSLLLSPSLSLSLSIYLYIYLRCAFIRLQLWAAPWQSLKLPFQQLISYASLKRSVCLSCSRSHSLSLTVCLPRLLAHSLSHTLSLIRLLLLAGSLSAFFLAARANPKGSSTAIYHTQRCTRCVLCVCVCALNTK